MRPLGGKLLLAAGSLLAFVALAELLVRVVGPDVSLPQRSSPFRFDQGGASRVHHVRDDRLGWRLTPDQTIRMQVEGGAPGGHVFRTNAHGMRGEPFEIEKARGVVRILVVGDSNAMGFGVPSDDAIYSTGIERILERHFASAPLRFEVINMGIDGFSSHQVRLLVDDYVPSMAPDFVCVQVGFNDHCLTSVPDRDRSFGRSALLDALERSMAYRWLRRRLLLATSSHERAFDPVPRVSPLDYGRNLREIVKTARGAGAEVLLLTTPARLGTPLSINEVPISEDGEVRWTTETSWIHERLERAGIRPPDQPAHPRFLDVVDAAIAEQPDLPTPRFYRARGLRAQGRADEAEAARRDALARDRERRVLEGYMAELRRLAAPGVGVIDVEAALRAAIELPEGPPSLGDTEKDLFIDFVHLGARGQVVVATAVAERIARRITERAGKR